jgi:glyoxylate reductase
VALLPRVLQLSGFPASPAVQGKLLQHVEILRMTRETLLAHPEPQIVGLLSLITDQVDQSLMDALPDLKVIANYGTGVEHIDLASASARNIQVTNTPGVLSDTVADLTWGLILATCRRIVESDHTVRSGQFPGWTPYSQLGLEVTGRTLGLVGMGQIGEKVARRARGFEMKVLYHQRTPLLPEKERALGVSYCSFAALLRESDIISLHTPLTPQTHHLINAETLRLIRPTSVLINTARGPVVDEAALVEALREKKLYGAGLDVFEQEPLVHPSLISLPNVVLTAHIGSATEVTRNRMGDLAIENLLSILQGKSPLNPVNKVSTH